MNDARVVETLGGCRVDGVPVRHGRALELVAVLALAKGSVWASRQSTTVMPTVAAKPFSDRRPVAR